MEDGFFETFEDCEEWDPEDAEEDDGEGNDEGLGGPRDFRPFTPHRLVPGTVEEPSGIRQTELHERRDEENGHNDRSDELDADEEVEVRANPSHQLDVICKPGGTANR